MAVAVAHGPLKEGNKLFNTREDVYDTDGHAGYRRFIIDIAYITSDLAVLVTEEGKLGGYMHCTSHTGHLSCVMRNVQSWLLVYVYNHVD